MVEVILNEHCAQIRNSWQVPKAEFDKYIDLILERYPDFRGGRRNTMRREWAVHNLLFLLGYKPERTGSVDFESPQRWGWTAVYSVLGYLAWLVIE